MIYIVNQQTLDNIYMLPPVTYITLQNPYLTVKHQLKQNLVRGTCLTIKFVTSYRYGKGSGGKGINWLYNKSLKLVNIRERTFLKI